MSNWCLLVRLASCDLGLIFMSAHQWSLLRAWLYCAFDEAVTLPCCKKNGGTITYNRLYQLGGICRGFSRILAALFALHSLVGIFACIAEETWKLVACRSVRTLTRNLFARRENSFERNLIFTQRCKSKARTDSTKAQNRLFTHLCCPTNRTTRLLKSLHLKPSVNWVDLVVQVINDLSKQKIDHSFEKCTHTAAHSANQRECAAGKAVDKLK